MGSRLLFSSWKITSRRATVNFVAIYPWDRGCDCGGPDEETSPNDGCGTVGFGWNVTNSRIAETVEKKPRARMCQDFSYPERHNRLGGNEENIVNVEIHVLCP
jgi:hypothetical protein